MVSQNVSTSQKLAAVIIGCLGWIAIGAIYVLSLDFNAIYMLLILSSFILGTIWSINNIRRSGRGFIQTLGLIISSVGLVYVIFNLIMIIVFILLN
jgi:hypothetical protein